MCASVGKPTTGTERRATVHVRFKIISWRVFLTKITWGVSYKNSRIPNYTLGTFWRRLLYIMFYLRCLCTKSYPR